MPYILEDATKTFSNLHKLDEHTKNRFPIKLGLDNSFFVQKLKKKFF